MEKYWDDWDGADDPRRTHGMLKPTSYVRRWLLWSRSNPERPIKAVSRVRYLRLVGELPWNGSQVEGYARIAPAKGPPASSRSHTRGALYHLRTR